MQDSHDTLQTRYRPNNWQGIIGQEHIVNIYKGIVKNKAYNYTRSYVLSGQAGSGKTTTLRVLANAIICDNQKDGYPCLECESCKQFEIGEYSDYLEIDAGRFNKVEDIAKLIDIAKQYPIHSTKHRIILLDEAHRLSNAAFDSLLKLLEDGKTRTIFMFATTEGSKIRPAIHSRSISLQVKPLAVKDIAKELIRICNAESIEYDTPSIMTIAYNFNGKMRDALKTLDMFVRANGNAKDIAYKGDGERFCDILRLSYLNRQKEALEILDDMLNRSVELGQTLCNTISALYCYPNNIISGIPENVLQSTKKIIDKHLRKIAEQYMQYKPQTYEQIKLFMLLLSNNELSGQKQQAVTQGQKRQLFKNPKKEVKSDDDNEL